MVDLLSRTGQSVNALKLSNALGIPVIPVDPRTGAGVKELIAALDGLSNMLWVGNTLAELEVEPVVAFRQVKEILKRSGAVTRTAQQDSLTSRIDRFVLHRYLGFPIFFLVLISLFAAIFWLAQPFMDMIEAGSLLRGCCRASRLIPSFFFLGDGAIARELERLPCFPQIMILFFLMTLLEDSAIPLEAPRWWTVRSLIWDCTGDRSFPCFQASPAPFPQCLPPAPFLQSASGC